MRFEFPAYTPEDPPLLGRVICLALQGGASLGAYTWGVLDEILQDDRLTIEGITGASAGAINAAALGVGYAAGGRNGARDRLQVVWETMARMADRRRRGPFDLISTLLRSLPQIRSRQAFYALTTRLAADFHIDPATMEPIRGVLENTLNFELLAGTDVIKVFVNVTDVQTGQPVIFSGSELTAEVVCASCAVPLLFNPIEIAGRWYWDGGLLGNPAIYPVIYGCESCDIVLVETLSASKDTVPRTAADVMSRTTELAALAGLVRELRTIQFVTNLLRESPRPGMREIRLHHIRPHRGLANFDGRRSFRADLPYFHGLRDLGRETGRAWLAKALPQANAIGVLGE